MILDHADAKVLIPHPVDANGACLQVIQDLRPLGVDDEFDTFFDLLRLEAELVNTLLIRVVAHRADKDQFGLWLELGEVLVRFEEGAESIDDHLMALFGSELRDVEQVAGASLFACFVHWDLLLQFTDCTGRIDDADGVLFTPVGAGLAP